MSLISWHWLLGTGTICKSVGNTFTNRHQRMVGRPELLGRLDQGGHRHEKWVFGLANCGNSHISEVTVLSAGRFWVGCFDELIEVVLLLPSSQERLSDCDNSWWNAAGHKRRELRLPWGLNCINIGLHQIQGEFQHGDCGQVAHLPSPSWLS